MKESSDWDRADDLLLGVLKDCAALHHQVGRPISTVLTGVMADLRRRKTELYQLRLEDSLWEDREGGKDDGKLLRKDYK